MWGIVPAAGQGSRIQPLAFSKELLPVGSRADGDRERPRAVSEYLIERLVLGGATRLCFVISPGKSDILEYYGGSVFSADVFYAVQPRAAGLCDALFRALPLMHDDEPVLIGLPDTIWFPEEGFTLLPDDRLSFLLFPVERPELFDAVRTDGERVLDIQVKQPRPGTHWVWGAFKMPGRVFRELYALWCARARQDEYMGTLVNAWLAQGGSAAGIKRGEAYVDVGTVEGYRDAIRLLSSPASAVHGARVPAAPVTIEDGTHSPATPGCRTHEPTPNSAGRSRT
jgi:dTDP-glucose pyrophosphorylase